MKQMKSGGFQTCRKKAVLAASLFHFGTYTVGDVKKFLKRHPDADPEDVRLTLISLQSPPLKRLNRSLRRG